MSRMRLFVAVWPPPAVLDRLAHLPRPVVPGLRWTTSDQWHVTLHFLGGLDDSERITLDDIWSGLVLPHERPEAVLGLVTECLGGGVLIAPVAGLDELARRVVAAMSGVGATSEPRRFRGHLTLARARRRNGSLTHLAGAPVSERWPVEEITLVRSQTHPAGARYDVLAHRLLG